MYILVLLIHIVVCLFLIIVILLQSGKAADLAGAFGGMGSQTAFGPRGSATLLSKATTASAAIYGDLADALDPSNPQRRPGYDGPGRPAQVKSIPVKTAPVPVTPQQASSKTIQIPLPPVTRTTRRVQCR